MGNNTLIRRASQLLLVTITFITATAIGAYSATRDPVFSVASGTTFSAPTFVAISVPFNGEVRYTRDGSAPSGTSTLYTGPLLVRWSEQIRAIAIVNSVSSSIVSASFTLDSNKYPNPNTGGTTAPVINLQYPTTAQ